MGDNGGSVVGRPEWLSVLAENPELIAWGAQVKKYGDGNMYVFQKSYINAGAIVLVPAVHTGLQNLTQAGILESPLDMEGNFVICYEGYERSGCFCEKRLGDSRRIVFLSSGLRCEEKENTAWVSRDLLKWDSANLAAEINNFLRPSQEEPSPEADSDNLI